MYTVTINDRGQITIPIDLRVKANINPKDNLEVALDQRGRLIITKKDIFSDLEDLIKRDLVNEGHSVYEIESLVAQRKRQLGEALVQMSADAETEIAEGKYSSLEQLKTDSSTEKP